MKKKIYQQPKMEVVQLDHADIICTSGGYNDGNMRIGGSDGILIDEEDW